MNVLNNCLMMLIPISIISLFIRLLWINRNNPLHVKKYHRVYSNDESFDYDNGLD